MSAQNIIIEGNIYTTSIPRQTAVNWQMDIVVEVPPTDNRSKANYYKLTIFKRNKEDFPIPSSLLNKCIVAECKLYGKQYTGSKGFTYSLSLVVKDYTFKK